MDRAGRGLLFLMTKNGYHSQKGLKVSVCVSFVVSRDEIDLNQLSFGLSAGVIKVSWMKRSFESGRF